MFRCGNANAQQVSYETRQVVCNAQQVSHETRQVVCNAQQVSHGTRQVVCEGAEERIHFLYPGNFGDQGYVTPTLDEAKHLKCDEGPTLMDLDFALGNLEMNDANNFGEKVGQCPSEPALLSQFDMYHAKSVESNNSLQILIGRNSPADPDDNATDLMDLFSNIRIPQKRVNPKTVKNNARLEDGAAGGPDVKLHNGSSAMTGASKNAHDALASTVLID